MPKLSREQLIDLVTRISRYEGTEEEQDELLDILQVNVTHPEVSDLIYYPPGGIELTSEQIVDKALKYKPIRL